MNNLEVSTSIITTSIAQYTDELLFKNNISCEDICKNKDIKKSILEFSVDRMIQLVINEYATGIFIIFKNGDSLEHDCSFIRSNAPYKSKVSYEDLVYEKGMSSIANDKNIPLAKSWSELFFIDEKSQNSDYYTKVINQSIDSERILRKMEYWSQPVDILNNDNEVIINTFPLIDRHNNIFGVLGIEIHIKFFKTYLMPFSNWKNNIHFLIKPKESSLEEESWSIYGNDMGTITSVKKYTKENEIHIKNEKLKLKLLEYKALVNNQEKKFIAAYQSLALYTFGSYFNDKWQNQWQIIAVSPKEEVLSSSDYFIKVLIFVSLFTSIICGIGIFILVSSTIKRIKDLPNQILNVDPNKIKQINKTNIAEIDYLIKSIEIFQKRIVESSTKISQILELIHLPLGCFEYQESNPNYVFITPSLKKMLGIKPDKKNNIYIPKKQWDIVFNKIKNSPFSLEEKIYSYRFSGDDQSIKMFFMDTVYTSESYFGVIMDETERTLKNAELILEADYDVLTGLFKRHAFEKYVLNKIKNDDNKVGLFIFGDLDGLKQINDTYGHEFGNRYIIEASKMMNGISSLNGSASRFSGDEFVVFIYGFDTRNEALEKFYKYRECHFNKTIEMPDKKSLNITISLGISVYPDDSTIISDLISYADYAMYIAKQHMKGSVKEFNKFEYQKNEVFIEKSQALVKLIDSNLISYTLQPIYNIVTKSIYGYEIFIYPIMQEFTNFKDVLETAKRESKQNEIKKMILTLICNEIKNNAIEKQYKVFVSSVDVVPHDELISEDFYNLYRDIFKQIVIEISLTEIIDRYIVMGKMNEWRKKYSLIAFVGFSNHIKDSLKLMNLTPDIMKIDASLLRNLNNDNLLTPSYAKINNIITNCKKSNILVAAYGVDTEDDFINALKLGVDMVQGNFIGHTNSKARDIDKTKLLKLTKTHLNKAK